MAFYRFTTVNEAINNRIKEHSILRDGLFTGLKIEENRPVIEEPKETQKSKKKSKPRIVKAKFNKTPTQTKTKDDESVESNKYNKRFKKTKKPPKL